MTYGPPAAATGEATLHWIHSARSECTYRKLGKMAALRKSFVAAEAGHFLSEASFVIRCRGGRLGIGLRLLCRIYSPSCPSTATDPGSLLARAVGCISKAVRLLGRKMVFTVFERRIFSAVITGEACLKK